MSTHTTAPVLDPTLAERTDDPAATGQPAAATGPTTGASGTTSEQPRVSAGSPTGASGTTPQRPRASAGSPGASPTRPLPWVGQVWREYGYLCLQFLLCSFAFTYAILVIALGAGLLVTVAGLAIPGLMILGARGWGAMYRGMDVSILGSHIAPPPDFVRPRGWWPTLGAMLTDATGWRALLYMVITFPLALVAWIVSTTWLAVGAGGLTYWIWWRALPYQTMFDGTRHRGAVITASDWYWTADTPAHIALLVPLGIAFLFMWALLTRGFALLFAALGRVLLGPTAGAIRVAELRRQRASAVEDADAKLRRIERDLHDGTQARLVAIAMQVGEAKDALAGPDGAAQAAALLDSAHASSKEALTELREIVRGIHPPALDDGLGTAVTTLAARSAVPVSVQIGPRVDVPPLAPAISSIAYYAVAELLTNVARHAHATHARVLVERVDADALHLRVTDDGRGGAVQTRGTAGVGGTGLAGLAKRVASVDGTFVLDSPDGGPTVVDITLPAAVR